jgi:hypothetical protein
MTDETNTPGSAEEQAAAENADVAQQEPEAPADENTTDAPADEAAADADEAAPADDQPAPADAEQPADETPAEDEAVAVVEAACADCGEVVCECPVVRLMHVQYRRDAVLHFYAGRIDVKAGVAEFPLSRPEWARNAFARGYRLDPRTGQPVNFAEVLARFNRGL